MQPKQPPSDLPPSHPTKLDSDNGELGIKRPSSDVSDLTTSTAGALATKEGGRMEAVLGDALLRFLRIRKGPRKEQYDPDAIATQPSIWDSDKVEEYKERYIHPKWENWSAFDPSARWTWKEERAVRHKVDLKIMVCIVDLLIMSVR